MKTVRLSVLTVVALTMAATLFLVGCEESTTDPGIVISPSSISVTNNWMITFVASPAGGTNSAVLLNLPLEWNMSDPRLGYFQDAAGLSAIYITRPGWAGPNTITVRDQAGREGVASISQWVE